MKAKVKAKKAKKDLAIILAINSANYGSIWHICTFLLLLGAFYQEYEKQEADTLL